jgi:hypothetical protein
LVCFIASFGGCAWFMIRSLSDFFKNDVVTSVRVNYVNGFTFPVIGICNLNFFNQIGSEIISKSIGPTPEMITFYPFQFAFLNLYKYDKDIFDFNPYDTILNCSYATESCDFENDFEVYYDFQYGACFRYNSGKNMNGDKVDQKKIFGGGSAQGLELEFFIGDVDKNNLIFSRDHGFNIFIQNQSGVESYYSDGINISPGTSNRIILSKHSWRKEPKPYSDCTGDLTSIDSYSSQTYKDSFSINKSYTYFDCFKLCQENYMKQKCNCTLLAQKNLRTCYIDDKYFFLDFNCTKMAFDEFAKNPLLIKKCDCPVECEKTYFTYSMSSSQFPTLKYTSYLLQNDLIKRKYPNMTHEELKKNVARVQIFFDEMKETVIEESIKTELSDLISNLGGTLGLFLGLSFLSLIEFVEAILQILFVAVKSNNQLEPVQ